jgi:autotransporter-associated beta strand protein
MFVGHAAELYWDGSSTGAGADGGPGTWSTAVSPANWDTAASFGNDVPWTDGSGAVFGGTAGAVSVSGTVSATSLQFSVPGYSVSGGTLILSGSSTIGVAADDAGGNGTILGSILSGSAAIVKSGSGTLTLSGANTFTGSFTIGAGTVKAASPAAFGNTLNGTTVSAGATLELNGQSLGAERITISGNGTAGAGAIVNTGAITINALQDLTLAGPARVGGSTRWDLRNNPVASFKMNGHTLEKTGENSFNLVATHVTSPGAIDILEGSVWLETTSSLGGSAANVMTIRSNATLVQWGNFGGQAWTAAFQDNGSWWALQESSRWDGPVSLAGATLFDVGGHGWGDNATMRNSGVISGPGSMTKTGPGTWTLAAINSFLGGTTVNDGDLVLAAASSGAGTVRNAVTVLEGGTLTLAVANALGTSPGLRVDPLNIEGGLVDNTSNASNAAPVINLTAGTLRSNRGSADPDAPGFHTLAGDAVINSLSAPMPSVITGRLHLGTANTGNASNINVEAGSATDDLRIEAAITEDPAGQGIRKLGIGLLAVDGPAFLSGNTTVESGTMIVGPQGSLADSPVTVKPGGRFGTTLGGKTFTSLTALPGSALVLPAGGGPTTTIEGTLELSGGNIGISPLIGANTSAGTHDLITAGAIIGSGVPVLDLGAAFGPTRATGSVAVNGNKIQLTLTGTGAELLWNNASAAGAANGTWNAALANFSRGGANDAFQAFDSVTFDDSVASGSNKTITLVGILAPARLTVANSNGDYTFSATGGLAGAGSLVKTGTSRLSIGGPNRHAMAGEIIAGGGILDFAGQSISAAGLTLAGGGRFDNTTARLGPIQLQSGSVGATLVSGAPWTKTTAGSVILTADNSLSGPGAVSEGHLVVGNSISPDASGSLGTGPLAISAGSAVTIARGDFVPEVANGFSGSGGLALIGSNNGTNAASAFKLSGDNSAFSGPVSLSNARVTVATGMQTGSGPISLTGRSAIHVSKVSLPNAISSSASGDWGSGGSFNGNLILEGATLTGPISLAGGTTTSVRPFMSLNQSTHSFITGPISESGGPATLAFVPIGSGNSVTLTGNSNYTGPTLIGGSVVVNVNGSLGATAVTVGGFSTLGGNGSIGSGGSLTFNNRGILKANQSGGALTVNGNVNLGPRASILIGVTPGPIVPGPIPVLQYTGTLTGTAANLRMEYPSLYRQAVFAFTPGLISVDIGAKSLIWKGTSSSTWQVGGANIWNTTGSGETAAFYHGDSVTFDDTGSGNVTSPYLLEPSSVRVDNPTKDYTISAAMTGPCSLLKTGGAALFMTSNGSYTGGTTVQAGKLEVSLSPLGTGPVSIAAGATLAGDATITGPVNIAGTVNPGLTGQSFPATLSTGPATLSGTYACQLGATASDRLTVTGDLHLAGAALILIRTFTGSGPATFIIASYTGNLSGSFSSVSPLPPGYALVHQSSTKRIVITRMNFDEWTASFPGLTDSTPGGDPDEDGIASLLEYVLGGKPIGPDAAILPVQVLGTGTLEFRFRRSDHTELDTTQTVQWSSDLVEWNDLPVPTASSGPVTVLENGGGPDDITVNLPQAAGTMFARLKVTKP